MAIPRERQRRRRQAHEGDRQDCDQREQVAGDEGRGEEPHEHAIEREHGDTPAGCAGDERATPEQLAASDIEFVMVNGILASLTSDRRWT